MGDLEKIDCVLKLLYQRTESGGMTTILSVLRESGIEITLIELKSIVDFIKGYGYAVFQIEPRGIDYRGAVTDPGKEFVESTSFSSPGNSILNI